MIPFCTILIFSGYSLLLIFTIDFCTINRTKTKHYEQRIKRIEHQNDINFSLSDVRSLMLNLPYNFILIFPGY